MIGMKVGSAPELLEHILSFTPEGRPLRETSLQILQNGHCELAEAPEEAFLDGRRQLSALVLGCESRPLHR